MLRRTVAIPVAPYGAADAVVSVLPRARRDALPEHVNFHDDGCEVAPHCLECPLSACRYELHNGLNSIRAGLRREEIPRLKGMGVGPDAIALRLGISKRSVFRLGEGEST